jgi:HAD superfamily hydrolase (TIGR01458 family)
MSAKPSEPHPELGLLLDIDGVLHVGADPIPGAVEALQRLREQARGLRLITNTTSKPRRAIVEGLARIGFDVEPEEVITPAANALAHCRSRGHRRALLLLAEELREDLEGLEPVGEGERPDAVVLGDLGEGFTGAVLNEAFRALIEGAELVALQHNRYWRSAEGLVMDVGAYSAALEYAAEVQAIVVGKPAREFFAAALASGGFELGEPGMRLVMVGDDIEADIGGALDAGLEAILVRTGKYREEAVSASGIEPSAILDSIAELPSYLDQ